MLLLNKYICDILELDAYKKENEKEKEAEILSVGVIFRVM